MFGIEFGRLEFLWGLPIVLLMLIIVAFIEFRGKRKSVISMDEETDYLKWSLIRKFGIFGLISLSALVVALSQPQISHWQTLNKYESNTQIAFLLDVSKSMAAQRDIEEPNRLERTKTIMKDIIGNVQGGEIAIYPFTAISRSHVPFTDNYRYLYETIEKVLAIESVPEPGSDIGRAIQVVLEKFDNNKPRKIIILFSDGEATGEKDSLDNALAKIRDARIELIVVGIGEVEGAKIPIFDKYGNFTGEYEKNRLGQEHITYLDEDFLRYIVSEADGKYFREDQIDVLKSHLDRLILKETIAETEKVKDNIDLSKYFILFGSFIPFLMLYKLYN